MAGVEEDRRVDQMLHIASLVLWFEPSSPTFLAQLARVEWLELPYLHLADEVPGKTVVLLEAPDESMLLQYIEQLRALPDVRNVQLVYHHAEAMAV